jgi:hypothetical protein
LVDEDLNYSSNAPEDCQGMIYHAWQWGPWPFDVTAHLTCNVDDDVAVNGVIIDQGVYAFNSGRGLPCDGIANGQHNEDVTMLILAGDPIILQLINNFAYGVSITGHITVTAR